MLVSVLNRTLLRLGLAPDTVFQVTQRMLSKLTGFSQLRDASLSAAPAAPGAGMRTRRNVAHVR
ncbi:hypothetical protein Afe04nite_05670 [Asanoa ferruginea]|nr:hypothetical protein Afe04nite_05670 [Asanoa ferruginea]